MTVVSTEDENAGWDLELHYGDFYTWQGGLTVQDLRTTSQIVVSAITQRGCTPSSSLALQQDGERTWKQLELHAPTGIWILWTPAWKARTTRMPTTASASGCTTQVRLTA